MPEIGESGNTVPQTRDCKLAGNAGGPATDRLQLVWALPEVSIDRCFQAMFYFLRYTQSRLHDTTNRDSSGVS
jgi:hypothetical protein